MKKRIFDFIRAHGTGYIPESLTKIFGKKEIKNIKCSPNQIKFAAAHGTGYVPSGI